MKGRTRPRTPRGSIARITVAVLFAGLSATACQDATGPEQLDSLTLTAAAATVQPTATVQLTAVGTRAGQDVTNLLGETYAVTSGGGTVSDTGVFTAPSTAGTSTITVTCGGRTATVDITVVAGPLATITVTPNPVTLEIQATQQFTAVGHDAFGNIVAITPVWSATSPPGTIDAGTGLFTAGDELGTYPNSVTATSGSISGSATVTVIAGPLATIEVTPNPVTLAIGEQQQFTAVGRDAGGNVVPIPNLEWSATNPPGTINASTGLFTAGNTTGTYPNSVTATSGSISGTATVTVTAGPVASIEVTPNPVTLETGEQQQFTAVGRDAGGNVVPISPEWSTTNPPGTINASTGLFTAGNTTGTFDDSVRATEGAVFGTATVTVTTTVVPPSGYRMIARVAWTCTDGSIDGSIATNQTAGEVPPGSATLTNCPVTGTIDIGSPAAKQAYQDFLDDYADLEAIACGTTLVGTLAGITLAPGVYCFDNAATLTGTLTLSGGATDEWLFKIGEAGIPGALTTDNFDVVMAGGASACNVSWWVRQAATMTTSNFQGHILAGAGISFTGGTYKGNAWSQEDVTVTGAVVTACDAP